MIFLNNVYITNEPNPFGSSYDRGNLLNYDKLDIYKYSLASLSKVYPWKKAIIYFKLSPEYHNREDELISFIKQEFNGIELILRNNRNEYVSDWIETYDLLDDDLIWFYCNHDHIFLDNTDYFKKYIDVFREKHSNELASIYFSHWPELLCYLTEGGEIEINNGQEFAFFNTRHMIDSIQILTKKLYKEWWINTWDHREVSNIFLPRSDFNRAIYSFKELNNWKIFVPFREACRHFDGYSHTRPKVNINDCPPLNIPEGFFANDIKISFENKKELGYTYLDPTNPNYFCSDPQGVDYKWTEEDIPEFIKKRISLIEKNNFDDLEMAKVKKRNLNDIIFSNAKYHSHWNGPLRDKYLSIIMKVYGYENINNI